jgi:hypothetical protein
MGTTGYERCHKGGRKKMRRRSYRKMTKIDETSFVVR